MPYQITPVHFNRGCLLRFTHMWYQISPCSWLGFWHLPQFKLRLGNHISDLWGQNWGQHSGFSEENYPKIGFFWKFQKMQFPAFGFKNWDFFWVGGVEKGLINFFSEVSDQNPFRPGTDRKLLNVPGPQTHGQFFCPPRNHIWIFHIGRFRQDQIGAKDGKM